MSGGPYPCTQMMPKATGGFAFPLDYVGGGGGDGDSEMMMGFADGTTLTADTYWSMRCSMPATLPSGTATLRLWTRTTGTGDIKINAKWASVAATEDPGSITLNAEGTTTQTYGAGDVDEYVKIDITLDADTGFTGAVEITTFSDYGVTNNSTQIAPTPTVSIESVSVGTIEFTAIVSYVDGTDDNYTSIFSKDGSFVEFGASIPDLIDRISRDISVRSFLNAIGVSTTIKPQNPDVNGVSWRFQVKSESGKTMAAWSETHVDDYYFLSEYGVGYWGFLATDGGVSALFDRLV